MSKRELESCDYYKPDCTRHDSILSKSTRKESVRSGSRRAAKKRKKERASTARAVLQQQHHAAALEAAPTSDETASELCRLVTQLLEEMDTITRDFHLMRLTFTLDDEVVHRAWYQSRVPTSFSSSSSSSSFSSPFSSTSTTTSSSSSASSSSGSGALAKLKEALKSAHETIRSLRPSVPYKPFTTLSVRAQRMRLNTFVEQLRVSLKAFKMDTDVEV